MSLGTGLFLSSLIISIVILYGLTKDRWAWRVIAKRFSVTLLLLISVGTIALVAFFVWDDLPARLDMQKRYAGISLGMTQDEIIYIKGVPSSVLAPEPVSSEWKGFYQVLETSKLDKGKKFTEYRDWHYKEHERYILVTFDEVLKSVTSIQCYSNDRLGRCPSIGGVSDGTPEQDVVKRLGPPTRSNISGTAKTLFFDNLGVELTLTKEEVYMLAIGVTKKSQ